MGNDTINFWNSAVWFPFGIAALLNPALVCLQADLRRRPSSGRSKLTRNSFGLQRMLGGISLPPPRRAASRYTSAAIGSSIALTGTRKENG
jgi:hypothetical protein